MLLNSSSAGILLVVIVIIVNGCYSEVIFAFEHFRHGLSEILPSNSILNDMYNFKVEGDGDLTPIGMRMHYMLGYKNRLRYHSLLSKIYDPKEIIVYSSHQTKAIMSAQAQLIGMFPPQSGTELTDDELIKAIPPNPLIEALKEETAILKNNPLPGNMQMVPVHLLDTKEVDFLENSPRSCHPLAKAKQKLKESPIVVNTLHKLNSTYGDKLMRLFKKNDTRFLFDYQTVYILTNNYMSDYISNNTNLARFKNIGIDIDKFYTVCYKTQKRFLFKIESNEDMAVLAVSPTMKKIISWMDERMKNDINEEEIIKNYDEPKFVMESGHAKTLVPFELFMKKIFKTPLRYPTFGSYLFLELHRDKKIFSHRNIDNYYIEYYFDNELLMRIPYSQFKSQIENYLWSNERIFNYCQAPLDKKVVVAILVAVVVICVMLFIFIVLFGIKKGKKRKKRKVKKKRVDEYELKIEEMI